jgi:hypothetical protein
MCRSLTCALEHGLYPPIHKGPQPRRPTAGPVAEEKERLASEHLKCLDELKVARSSVMELEKGLGSTKSILNDNSLELQKEKDSAAS